MTNENDLVQDSNEIAKEAIPSEQAEVVQESTVTETKQDEINNVEEPVSTGSDTIDDESDTEGNKKVAEAKVEIDLSKYTYTKMEEEDITAIFEKGLSIYSAIDRSHLATYLYNLGEIISILEYRLREEPLTAAESNTLRKQLELARKELDKTSIISECLAPGTSGEDGLLDKRGDYRYGIAFGDKGLSVRGRPPKLNLTKSDNPEIFLNVLSSALGSASEIRIPLPASGFSVTLSAPTKPQIIGLLSRINRLEQKVARSAVGYTYSAQVADTISEIISEFLSPKQIKRCSLQVPYEDLTKYIKRSDIDVLLGHFAWLLSPNGYNYVLRCLNVVHKDTGVEGERTDVPCGYTEEAKVDILDMIFYDNSRLTGEQRSMLSNSNHTVEDLARYQDISDNVYLKDYSVIELDAEGIYEKIYIKLRSPSIHETLEYEDKWLIKLDDYIDRAGARDLNNEAVATLANEISSSMVLSMYASYIDSIEITCFNENNERVSITTSKDDYEAIISALNQISENDKQVDIIGNKINEYIERLKIGLMGIPNKLCPKCHLPQPDEIIDTKLIPVNPLKDFFTVCHIKTL